MTGHGVSLPKIDVSWWVVGQGLNSEIYETSGQGKHKESYLPQALAAWYAFEFHGTGSVWLLGRVRGPTGGGCRLLRDCCQSVVCYPGHAVERRSQGCVWAGPCVGFWLLTIFGKA